MKQVFVAAAVLAASGCSVFAGKSDYADYRAIRLARDPDSRQYALQQYAEHHPDGQWAREVEIERSERETATFEAGKSTREGLEHYLRAYPDGTFAAQARSRLAAVEVIERRKRDEDRQAQQLLAARKEREQELQRTWVTRFAGYWANTLVKLTAWGSPIPEVARLNPQFSRAFGATPRPRCTADECVKYYASPYGVPVPGGTRVERVLSLVLRLRMEEGKLDRAELLMPSHGFSRWYELEQRKVVATGDATARNQAVAWALARLQEAIKPVAGELSPLDNYALAPISAPSIAPTGELTDTTAEDPSAPQQQLTAADPSRPQPDIATLVAPRADEPSPDMVFSPLGITKEGRTFTTQPSTGSTTAAPAPSGADVMVMEPLAVPKDGPAAGSGGPTAPGPVAPSGAPAEEAVAAVRALQGRGLRVVLFAAAGNASGAEAYDGILVERVSAAAPPVSGAKPSGKGKPAAGKPSAANPAGQASGADGSPAPRRAAASPAAASTAAPPAAAAASTAATPAAAPSRSAAPPPATPGPSQKQP